MERQEDERFPVWQKTATSVVAVLVAAAFAYIAYAYYTQRTFSRLVGELTSSDGKVSREAADKLASTDGALPYLSHALVNSALPEKRALCAEVLIRRIEARRAGSGPAADGPAEQRRLRRGLNLEAITSALEDESPVVRAKALEIVEGVGTDQNYQRVRRETLLEFEALLKKLASDKDDDRRDAAEKLRDAGIRSLPYLVGTVFSDDADFRLRGLNVLRATVQDVLRGSNQRLIVQLLGRRRCRLLLREMTRLDQDGRSVVTDVLNVSGRVPDGFFASFLEKYASLDRDEERLKLLSDEIERLEEGERLRGAPGLESEKIRRLSGAAGEEN